MKAIDIIQGNTVQEVLQGFQKLATHASLFLYGFVSLDPVYLFVSSLVKAFSITPKDSYETLQTSEVFVTTQGHFACLRPLSAVGKFEGENKNVPVPILIFKNM